MLLGTNPGLSYGFLEIYRVDIFISSLKKPGLAPYVTLLSNRVSLMPVILGNRPHSAHDLSTVAFCNQGMILPHAPWRSVMWSMTCGTWALQDSPRVDDLPSGVSVEDNVAITTVELAMGVWVDLDPATVLHTPDLKETE